MSGWADINIRNDPKVAMNWESLFSLLRQPEHERSENKGAIDGLLIQMVDNWLDRNDQCGVAKDLMDLALTKYVGTSFEQIAGNWTAGNATEDALAPQTGRSSIQVDDVSLAVEERGGGRNLQFFTETTCSTFESTIFLGSMLSFSSCAEIDIGRLFGTVEENLVGVGLNCLNTFLQPFQRTEDCASRNFQNYVMDECVKGVVGDDILGHIFQLFLITPKKTCGCMKSLAAVPLCRVDVSSDLSIDGLFASKMACLLESQVCSQLDNECDNRLTVLDECLPDLLNINNDNFDCEEVICNCERLDSGLLNYAGRAMELPMSDMCVDRATEKYIGEFIPERYAVFQEKCGAQFVNAEAPPTQAPTVSPAPTVNPSEDLDISSLIREREDATVSSVVSGILLALAITGIASIFLVLVLCLWRKRHRSRGMKVQTISEMKAHAQEQIRRLESDVRRMEQVESRIDHGSDEDV